LRVISGTLKGRKLASFRGRHVRPTADRVRESLFNILNRSWEDRDAIDLFAGTGGLGIEALSRGAARVVFIEQHPRALDVLEKNIRTLGLGSRCEIVPMSVDEGVRVLQRKQQTFDVAFLDPPYGSGLADSALHLLSRGAIMRRCGVIVAEHHFREEISSSYGTFALSDRRRYGETVISFFTA
jgi:16S rRNA (guanine(966)-N(2))-methyltransferase RsmD